MGRKRRSTSLGLSPFLFYSSFHLPLRKGPDGACHELPFNYLSKALTCMNSEEPLLRILVKSVMVKHEVLSTHVKARHSCASVIAALGRWRKEENTEDLLASQSNHTSKLQVK